MNMETARRVDEQTRAAREANEMRALLFALWENGHDFEWHHYYPSFATFLRAVGEWADARS